MVGPNNALCCLDKILKQGRCGLGSLIRSGFTMWFIKINSYKKDPLSELCRHRQIQATTMSET